MNKDKKENPMKTAASVVRLAAILVLLAGVITISGASAATEKTSEAQLAGSWNLAVSTPSQSFPGLITFSEDGGMVTDEPPLPGETSGHGNWVRRDHGEVAYTFIALFAGPDGSYQGRLKVVGTLRPDDGAVRWSGPFKIEAVDSSGQPFFADSGTFRLTRIAVEQLK